MRAISSGDATTPSDPRVARQPRQAHHLVARPSSSTPTAAGRRRARLVSTVTARMRRAAQAFAPAGARHLRRRVRVIIARLPRRVQVEEAHAETRSLDAGLRDGVRDVVELEVEEDVARRGEWIMRTTVGSRLQEELLADLEGADLAARARGPAAPRRCQRSTSSATIRRCGACRWRGGPGITAAPPAPRPARRPPPPGPRSTSPPARGFTSTQPLASARGPTVTRTGRPIRSASLNLTPGRSSRSSSSDVDARARSSVAATRSAVSRSAASVDVHRHDVRARTAPAAPARRCRRRRGAARWPPPSCA